MLNKYALISKLCDETFVTPFPILQMKYQNIRKHQEILESMSLCIWHVGMWQGPCVLMSICLHQVQKGMAGLKNETIIFFSLRIIPRRKSFEFYVGKSGRCFPYMLFHTLSMDS